MHWQGQRDATGRKILANNVMANPSIYRAYG